MEREGKCVRDSVEIKRSTFARRVDEVRMQEHLTKNALAERAGMSVPGMYNILCGRCNPSLFCAMNIAKALDVSLDWLCGLKED